MIDLPRNWEWTTLNEISDVERGITFPKEVKTTAPKENYVPCLRTANVQEYVDWNDLIFVPIEYVVNDSKWLLAEDILISMANSRELVGKTSFVHVVEDKSTFGGFISAIRSHNGLLPKYLFYYLREGNTQEWLRSASSHTVNIANLSLARIAQLPVPIAPFSEQNRIVAKLDAVFARTRQAREELERIPTLIEHYKQAILAAAFRGDLTADWREQWSTATNTSQSADLPPGWTVHKLEDIAEIQSGLALGKKRNWSSTLTEVPYLRVANVQRGYLNLEEIKKLRITPQELERLRLKKGDILMNEGGDRDKLGRGWIWNGEIEPCIHQNHVFRVRLHDNEFPPEYISIYTNEFGQGYFLSEGKQTTNLASISKSKVSALPVPVPPKDEAHEIVKQIMEVFAWLDTVLDEATNAMHLLNPLEQATLAKAFRGELVPQDPNDEPASVLLERIREARSGKQPLAQKRKKHT